MPARAYERSLRELGVHITKRRERMGLSQDAFAEKAGLSRHYVGQIERGAVNPSYVVLHKLARALGCEVMDLFPNQRYSLTARSITVAKLVQSASPEVREAVVTLLISSEAHKRSRRE